ncbi:hypothetical protein J3458_013434 [Metarhizium acridum]|uniref:uncharacterized protein n=1 Tax=Metarhizium acridum TaxID=92637 RepID=UPI001C6BEE81|nr:hypothetical protein J3458_013434 [Metarhizium acridum]
MSRSNEYPAASYPRTAEECWDLGGSFYQEWYSNQQGMDAFMREYDSVKRQARDAQRRIDREVPGSQQQRALVRQHGAVLQRYKTLQAQLDRQTYLENSMRGLARYMQRHAMITKNDVPTFPVNI